LGTHPYASENIFAVYLPYTGNFALSLLSKYLKLIAKHLKLIGVP